VERARARKRVAWCDPGQSNSGSTELVQKRSELLFRRYADAWQTPSRTSSLSFLSSQAMSIGCPFHVHRVSEMMVGAELEQMLARCNQNACRCVLSRARGWCIIGAVNRCQSGINICGCAFPSARLLWFLASWQFCQRKPWQKGYCARRSRLVSLLLSSASFALFRCFQQGEKMAEKSATCNPKSRPHYRPQTPGKRLCLISCGVTCQQRTVRSLTKNRQFSALCRGAGPGKVGVYWLATRYDRDKRTHA
jgi:hypothetical protein